MGYFGDAHDYHILSNHKRCTYARKNKNKSTSFARYYLGKKEANYTDNEIGFVLTEYLHDLIYSEGSIFLRGPIGNDINWKNYRVEYFNDKTRIFVALRNMDNNYVVAKAMMKNIGFLTKRNSLLKNNLLNLRMGSDTYSKVSPFEVLDTLFIALLGSKSNTGFCDKY